jgi:hypothetical protein
MPGEYLLDGNTVTNGNIKIQITSLMAFELRITEGKESRYYLQTSSLPVLEVHTTQPGVFKTEFSFK